MEKLEDMRKGLGLSRTAVARLKGCTHQSVAAAEHGVTNGKSFVAFYELLRDVKDYAPAVFVDRILLRAISEKHE